MMDWWWLKCPKLVATNGIINIVVFDWNLYVYVYILFIYVSIWQHNGMSSRNISFCPLNYWFVYRAYLGLFLQNLRKLLHQCFYIFWYQSQFLYIALRLNPRVLHVVVCCWPSCLQKHNIQVVGMHTRLSVNGVLKDFLKIKTSLFTAQRKFM